MSEEPPIAPTAAPTEGYDVQRSVLWATGTAAVSVAAVVLALWPLPPAPGERYELLTFHEPAQGRDQIVAYVGAFTPRAPAGVTAEEGWLELRVSVPAPKKTLPDPALGEAGLEKQTVRATLTLGTVASAVLFQDIQAVSAAIGEGEGVVEGQLFANHVTYKADGQQVSGVDLMLPWPLFIGIADGAPFTLELGEDLIALPPEAKAQALRILYELRRRGVTYDTYGTDLDPEPPRPGGEVALLALPRAGAE